MSVKSEAGKREWQERRATYGPDLHAQIEEAAAKRSRAWAAGGRVPFFVRVKARLRGQRLGLPSSGA